MNCLPRNFAIFPPKKTIIAALVGAALVVFAFPRLGQAQSGATPRGQVLQATTSCDRNNALTVTADPNPVTVGQKIKITSEVKPECQSGLNGSSSYLYQIYNRGASNPFQSDLRQGLTATMEFNATAAQFSPGGHAIDTVLSYGYDSNSGSWLYEFKGSVQVTSVAAQGGGTAQLSVVPSNGVDVGLTTSTKSFDVSFTAGSDGKTAAQVSYKCSATAPELKVAVTGGSAKVSCEYPKQAASHAVTIQALDSTGTLIPGAQWSGNVTLTGNEVNQTGTDSTGNPLILFFNLIIGGVLKLFIEAMGWGAAAIGTMLEAVLTIRTFSDEFAQVVYPAWEIFRNLGNIVFILAIVAIGVATVFRISQYQVKDLLVKLILGAILINFSLTIAQAVLGISDTLQQQFLSDGSGALRSIINALFVSNIWSNAPNVPLGDFSETIRILSQFFIAFAAFFALLGVAILVCVRVVMLWLLLMLSPIPYVAMVLPATRKFSSQWWDKFINWALVTPAVGFMLNLTALMTTKNRDVIEKLTASSQIALNESWLNSVAFSLASNIIPLIFLYMTLQVATSFGKGAGGFVTKSLNKVSGMAFAPAAAMGGYAVGAAKAGVDKAKDKAKIGYLDKVTKYLGPESEKDAKGWKGAAFNLATGGSVWEANKKKRKSDLADKQALVGAYAKDARSLAKGETPKAVQALRDSELAKAQKDKKEDIRDNTAAENTKNLADVLKSAASSFGKTVEMLARTDLALEKGSFDDLKREAVIQYLDKKSAGTGPAAAAAATELAALRADPKRSASIEHFYEAGAAAGMSKRHLEQLRDKVNAKMISDGKLDNVIDPIDLVMVDGSEKSTKREFTTLATAPVGTTADTVLNDKFRKKRWEKKSVQEQASSMHADMFTNPVLVASFMAKWSKLAPRKKDDAVAAMSSEKIKKIEDLYATKRTELDAELGGYSLPTGATVATVLDEFKTKAGF